MELNKQTIFSVAQTDLNESPFNNHGRTLRIVVPCNIAANSLQVMFSNQFGYAPLTIGAVTIAKCNKDGAVVPASFVPVVVGGHQSFVLQAGQDILSDDANIKISPGEYIAVSVYYPTEERAASGNWVAASSQRSRPGNFTVDGELPGAHIVSRAVRTVIVSDTTVNITNISQIIAKTEKPGRVLACFGDSITQQSNWTDPFSRLLHHKYPGEISLCNIGIGGNRLLRPSPQEVHGVYGIAGIERFEKDVLALHGLTHVIINIGTNDIGQPGSYNLPLAEIPSLEEYISGMEKLAAMAHGAGVKVYAGTITPREINKIFDEKREEMRRAMNEWICTADCFDAVIDFDAATSPEDGTPGLREGCFLPDNLHPSPYGGVIMAKSIDLSLFE